jgi:hypothetical protein
MTNISVRDLSSTISELVDLDADQASAIESALNRAISSKDISGGANPAIAGGIFVPMPPTKEDCPPNPWQKNLG